MRRPTRSNCPSDIAYPLESILPGYIWRTWRQIYGFPGKCCTPQRAWRHRSEVDRRASTRWSSRPVHSGHRSHPHPVRHKYICIIINSIHNFTDPWQWMKTLPWNNGVDESSGFMGDTAVKTVERESVKQLSTKSLKPVNQGKTKVTTRHIKKGVNTSKSEEMHFLSSLFVFVLKMLSLNSFVSLLAWLLSLFSLKF